MVRVMVRVAVDLLVLQYKVTLVAAGRGTQYAQGELQKFTKLGLED